MRKMSKEEFVQRMLTDALNAKLKADNELYAYIREQREKSLIRNHRKGYRYWKR